mmetsp:Transcript_16005/g.24363  ORF Transcript_16005/g.24363 Transcript_16005/m.24363 type:complete len:1069 (+) Transcript_16005:197-3403(+)|eukprot:CAMPEP_0118678256 /NCGR_PEP_ID=MMETSP0800-20121206/3110_1 /TAXON_ID=210618 ORGANISM="Striatella unipunctata, Strain CCMP2910" /NCGR_SAMPLE_ID=MMETSP0800 /ASSEMBLY_ACC=CAM_ASM_000638 /LENGTH=1068 /DNA_ID=CAMNT_0006574077 /DNA_START=132 /DNA_END=3338 /DNA_ORIENTATION=+
MSVGDGSSDDDDFDYEANAGERRYPVHDCCEFEDVESLRRLIVVRRDESDAEASSEGSGDDESSTDENESRREIVAGQAPSQGVRAVESTIDAVLGSKRKRDKEGENNEDEAEPKKDIKSEATSHDPSSASTQHGLSNSSGVERKQNEEENGGVQLNLDGTMQVTPMSEAGENVAEEPSDVAIPESNTKQGDRRNATNGDGANGKRETLVNSGETSTAIHEEKKQPLNEKAQARPEKPGVFYSPYDLDERDDDENTPLHVAIHARKLEHVRLLVDAGASVHLRCDGSCPIHTAISIGGIPAYDNFAFQCVSLLMSKGAELIAKDDSFHTPLYLACMMKLPRVVGLILADKEGATTLNKRADRVGGRPLHAAAKFDTVWRAASRNRSRPDLIADHIQQNESMIGHKGHNQVMSASSLQGSSEEMNSGSPGGRRCLTGQQNGSGAMTQMLLGADGVEVDAMDSHGRTPLHVACSRGNWAVARLLLHAGANPLQRDRQGFSPGQLAAKRGMAIPNDLLKLLGADHSESLSRRDLIVDPDGSTLLLCHELCSRHQSCPPIVRGGFEAPPENVRRLHVLINEEDGILRGGEFGACKWDTAARRAALADVLKVHEYTYVEKISGLCSQLPDHHSAVASLDSDTVVSRWSFEAALRAAGSVCQAVDKVISGEHRNAFCAIRPPGHHAGPRGIVKCDNDTEGSHGFCLLNNVAIGAAYARSMYRHEGIRKVAIIDFDVHHGNGTEEIIRQLVPQVQTYDIRAPFTVGGLQTSSYRPWLDETDVNEVFFASTHGYGPRVLELGDNPPQGGWFYPASGRSVVTESISDPSRVEKPTDSDFIMSQTWTRMGRESRTNCCKIINCGLNLPRPDDLPGSQRLQLRDSYRKVILPRLREFDPDFIFVSAGFDAHRKDSMNFGYGGMIEDDYEWVTEQLVKVANTCCNGRIVSVLEGGYKIHGGIVSPFARSVASHVRSLVDGGRSRALYDAREAEWESQFELHMVEESEKKRQQKIDRLHRQAELARRHLFQGSSFPRTSHKEHMEGEVGGFDAVEEPMRKRPRNPVDYRALYEEMKRQGLG